MEPHIKIEHANAGPATCINHPDRIAVEKGPFCDGCAFLCAECADEYLKTDFEPGTVVHVDGVETIIPLPCGWKPESIKTPLRLTPSPQPGVCATWRELVGLVLVGVGLAAMALGAVGLVWGGVRAIREIVGW